MPSGLIANGFSQVLEESRNAKHAKRRAAAVLLQKQVPPIQLDVALLERQLCRTDDCFLSRSFIPCLCRRHLPLSVCSSLPPSGARTREFFPNNDTRRQGAVSRTRRGSSEACRRRHIQRQGLSALCCFVSSVLSERCCEILRPCRCARNPPASCRSTELGFRPSTQERASDASSAPFSPAILRSHYYFLNPHHCCASSLCNVFRCPALCPPSARPTPSLNVLLLGIKRLSAPNGYL